MNAVGYPSCAAPFNGLSLNYQAQDIPRHVDNGSARIRLGAEGTTHPITVFVAELDREKMAP